MVIQSIDAPGDGHIACPRANLKAVVVVDSGGIIQSLNPDFGRMLGYAPSELIGRPISTLDVPDQEPSTPMERSPASSAPTLICVTSGRPRRSCASEKSSSGP